MSVLTVPIKVRRMPRIRPPSGQHDDQVRNTHLPVAVEIRRARTIGRAFLILVGTHVHGETSSSACVWCSGVIHEARIAIKIGDDPFGYGSVICGVDAR